MRKERRHYSALVAPALTAAAAFLGRLRSRSVVITCAALALLLLVAAGLDLARGHSATSSSRDASSEPVDVASAPPVAPSADGRSSTAATDADDDPSTDADTSTDEATAPTATTEVPTDAPEVTSPDASSTTIPTTTTSAAPASTVASAARTPAAPTTLPPSTTTSAAPTTTVASSTTVPTTTVPPSTTEATPTTTTTDAPAPTTLPVEAPGSLSVIEESTTRNLRNLDVHLVEPTGAPGTIRFSREVSVVEASNLACGSTSCTTVGATGSVWVLMAVRPGRITIELLDASGTVVDVYRSGG